MAVPTLTALNVASAFGAERLPENDSPPRITWTPTSDAVAKGKRTTGSTSVAPRNLMTRRAGVTVTVWAAPGIPPTTPLADHRNLEQLLDTFLAAVHCAAFGDYEVVGVSYLDADGKGDTRLGRMAEVQLTFDVPVLDTYSGQVEAPLRTLLPLTGTMGTTTATPPP